MKTFSEYVEQTFLNLFKKPRGFADLNSSILLKKYIRFIKITITKFVSVLNC